MVESYEVESTLSVKDELTIALKRATEHARTLSKVLREVEEASGKGFGARRLRAISNFQGISTKAIDSVKTFALALSGAADAGERLSKAMTETEAAARSLKNLKMIISPTGGTGAERGHRGAGGADALLAGGILGGAGAGTLGVLGRMINAGGSYNSQINQLALMGFSPQQIAASQSAAMATFGAFPQFTPAENLKTIGETYSALGNSSEAIQALNPMRSYGLTANSILKANGIKQPSDPYLAVRSAENLGWTIDPKTGGLSMARLEKFLTMLEKIEIGSHGRLSEKNVFAFSQQAGPIGRTLSATGLLKLAPVVAEMGGPRAGTALASASSQLIGGIMAQRNATALEALGLLN